MNVYVDTNILISFIHEKDAFHEEISQILAQTDIKFVTGLITLLEFHSVIHEFMQNNIIQIDEKIAEVLDQLSTTQKVQAVVDLLMNQIPLEFISTSLIEQYKWNNLVLKMENNLQLAIKLSTQLNLRSLDLLQLASSVNIKLLMSISIDYFLTNNKEILKNAKKIYKLAHIVVISTHELIDLLKVST